jgi:hypothetical protein
MTHATTTWSDNDICPFCSVELTDPGAGFIDHIDDSAECEAGFDEWRTNVAGDVRGGWIA